MESFEEEEKKKADHQQRFPKGEGKEKAS